MANILILGGNGFIGENLIIELNKRGEQVISFDLEVPKFPLSGVKYIQGNFFDDQILDVITNNIDIIIHAISTINPGNSNIKYMQGYQLDFIQSIKLCEIVNKKNIKMIFLSSGGTVYGDQKVQPIKEDAPTNPINHYGNIKLCIENVIHTFNKQNATSIKIARIANPYGRGQDFRKGVGFIDAVLKKGILGQMVEIYGDGEIVRDYVYISDVCQMLCSLIEYEGDAEIFNLGTGIGNTQNEIINYVKKWIPSLEVVYKDSRSVDVPKMILDNTRITNICNLKLLSLNEGIDFYYHYLKDMYSEEGLI